MHSNAFGAAQPTDLVDAVEAEGMACVVTNTVMSSPEVAAELSRRILGCVGVVT